MFHFKWLIPNVLAGGCHPLLNGNFDLNNPDYYENNGINLVISTFEQPLSHNIRKSKNWDYHFSPTKDGHPPSDLYDTAKKISNAGGSFVHCLHGLGRTATILAAYLIFGGYAKNAKEAVKLLREHYDPGSIHTPNQYISLVSFAGDKKNEDDLKEDIGQLFKKQHNYYSGIDTYKKLFDLGKRELALIEDKYGQDSPEYAESKQSHHKIKRILDLTKLT